MDINTIIQELNRRFAASLPEFYKRQEREFADKLDEITLDNARMCWRR